MIKPGVLYPLQTDVDGTNYPWGKARNVVSSGDGTGTPWEKNIVNDWFGFSAALVAAAGITPSGSPETAVSSQLLAAIVELNARRSVGAYQFALGARRNAGQTYSLTTTYQSAGFSQPLTDSVQVPVAGKYRVAISGQVDSSSTANPTAISVLVAQGGTLTGVGAGGWRYSASASDIMVVSCEAVLTIATPAAQLITIVSNTSGLQWSPGTVGTLIVERLI